ncbi:bifunctional 3-deoxy-7-phosphoheptulonate synthase/chorismate mutase type II [Ancylomarina longa]|uniref:chorismate mutase n=1 Tax=Ancylomarina longa TaxID=2487017 RepID=A0A434AZL3_9BACT|nr:bifunctional 3-deoxy-7-phosphoheptulonate synthase/chorismate mutase type II [Ancylomarina longa]RUT79974.1 3-deoxy-7-phosphoheptulonate synthase [Ancylomarina longa]
MSKEMKIKDLSSWPIKNTTRPLIISGPCSAETEEQVLTTAKGIKAAGIPIFRAGIWKPRTRPNSFEGIGAQGLIWLQKVKAETGLLTATEVANARHVELAVGAGVDILWIGARTTVNPFAVQEIADALRGKDIPILVKNPINPDLELWIGAIERLYAAGLTRIAAIHRGFSTYQKQKYRNDPQWQIPIELKRRLPQVPLFCDPSHITGDRNLLDEIAQKSMDLNYEGLIIESHCKPEEAWSDAKQQLTPQSLQELLANLVLRDPEANNEVINNTLGELRHLIDDFDEKLLELLENRMQIAKTIGHYKKENNITVLQNKRWSEILEKSLVQGIKKGFSEQFVSNLFKAIHQESINQQEDIMNS